MFQYGGGYIACFFLSSLCYLSVCEKSEKVAFIFAGSARSFILHPVRKTIQRNLILSFCPPESCQYDVFARVSANDNNHIGLSAEGEIKTASDSERDDIRLAFRDIEPPSTSNGHLHLSYYEINSDEEVSLMKNFEADDHRLRIYRQLDPRRYSMYFTRWKAYEKMLRHERLNRITYTWVVHARLDIAWSAPVASVNHFLPGKFYGPDSWHSEIPDTFTIMTRNLSDYFYSMTDLMTSDVLCLGGPNFDLNTIHSHHLMSKGFNSSEVNFIQQEDCRKKFPDLPIVPIPKSKDFWSTAGYSESFLKRKLKHFGYDVLNGGVILVPLFMYIVRLPFRPFCFYLNSGSFISWLRSKQAYNAALFTTCIMANDDLRKYASKDTSRCAPMEDSTNIMAASASLSRYHESCLLQPQNTDLNFLPFRLRSKTVCLTSLPYYMNMTSCINNIARHGLMQKYADEQLYYFYPLISTPQKIMQHTTITNKKLCLTAVIQASSNIDIDEIPIKFDDCSLTSDKQYPSSQMFTVLRLNLTNLAADRINMMATTVNLKPLTGVTILWQHRRYSRIYCLFYVAKPTAENAFVVLRKCPSYQDNAAVKGFTLIAERSRTTGPPYRQGITIGAYPSS